MSDSLNGLYNFQAWFQGRALAALEASPATAEARLSECKT